MKRGGMYGRTDGRTDGHNFQYLLSLSAHFANVVQNVEAFNYRQR